MPRGSSFEKGLQRGPCFGLGQFLFQIDAERALAERGPAERHREGAAIRLFFEALETVVIPEVVGFAARRAIG